MRIAGLPADSHVHSEWSWDAPYTSMERACERAAELGLPSIAFTEHADFTSRHLGHGVEPSDWQRDIVTDGILTPPAFDVDGYLVCLSRCRDRFPGLRILSGVELGEPHWHDPKVAELIKRARFDRVLVSLHTLPAVDTGHTTVDAAYATALPGQIVRAYLRELRALVTGFDDFDVLAHIDYAARYWPRAAGEYPLEDFRDEYQAVLSPLAAKGKALEVNTGGPLAFDIVRWWHELEGQAITFGSDAHRPEQVARGFAQAAAFAEAAGFAPGRDPQGPWMRC
ncbi:MULTISPECIES: PHP domain-containing protein [unclassified Kitasatospora]|uniref:PHP domain-containing protein n=1 Tax=unclassified Kitasatospora TaxID=2633591 RepID=UPI002475CB92|nr:PHP domain-containing protein [Kitasatospora sp. MAP12-44]